MRIGADGLCHCDEPPHPYDPSWCGGGRLPSDRVTIIRVPVCAACGQTLDRCPTHGRLLA